MGRRRAIIIGAGALGLGFLGERLAQDYALHIADTSAKEKVLRRLQSEQGFTVNLCGPGGITERRISGSFSISCTDTAEGRSALEGALAEADIVLTATGSRFLDSVVATVRPALNRRVRKVWLVFCENGMRVAEAHSEGLKQLVIPADTVMSRMCRFADQGEQGYTTLWPGHEDALVAEEYRYFPLDLSQCGNSGPFTSAFSVIPNDQFKLWKDIKFYLHNGIHAFVAYRACLQGVARFPDVPLWIRDQASNTMLREVIPAIVVNHPGAGRAELKRYGIELLERIFSPFFNDSIERGVRGVQEKLAPSERLAGGCEYIRRAGIEPKGYEGTLAAAREVLARRK